MKLNIITVLMGFFILVVTSGCVNKEVHSVPINTFAIEKSAIYKKSHTNSKIINETKVRSMTYPYTVNMLLLSKKIIPSLIHIADKGIMSEEYYINQYIEEQDLIHLMFKKRNSFAKFHVQHVNQINTPLNNKEYDYDYVIYFDTSEVGELDIYLKENSTNNTFLIWNSYRTKIDPIKAVENILISRLKYEYLNSYNTKDNNSIHTMSKATSKTKSIKSDSSHDTLTATSTPTTKIMQDFSSHNPACVQTETANKSMLAIKYKDIIRERSGCFAYGLLNQCVVW